MGSQSYRDLVAWQKAMDLATSLYRFTGKLPDSERYGFIAQLRRAAVSIPSNIAEGQSRESKREFVRYLEIAYGSLAEIETQLLLLTRVDLAPESATVDLLAAAAELGRVLNGLVRSLRVE